jgi:hypothetical protein
MEITGYLPKFQKTNILKSFGYRFELYQSASKKTTNNPFAIYNI